jgi:hypothetical protein
MIERKCTSQTRFGVNCLEKKGSIADEISSMLRVLRRGLLRGRSYQLSGEEGNEFETF